MNADAMHDNGTNGTNVEDVVAALRRDLEAARASAARDEGPQAGAGLATSLAWANRAFLVGSAEVRGLRGLRARIIRTVLRGLLGEINTFHAHVVRTLNGLAARLDAQDGAARDARLERLGQRLEEVDALDLDARLRRVEKRLSAGERRAP